MKKRAGFTLVEMLVVITMIGLLMATIATGLARARRAAQIARAETQLREILTACGQYLMLNQKAPPGMSESGWTVVAGDFLNELITPDEHGFVYLSVSPAQLKNGAYGDPWGNPYEIKLNAAKESATPADLVIKASAGFINVKRK